MPRPRGQERIVYEFLIDGGDYAFLQLGGNGILDLGLKLAREIMELNPSDIGNILNTLINNYAREYNGEGITEFTNLIDLAQRPNAFWKVDSLSEDPNSDYLTADWYFMIDFDDNSFSYASGDNHRSYRFVNIINNFPNFQRQLTEDVGRFYGESNQTTAIYGFKDSNSFYRFLQVGNANPDQLGVRIVEDLSGLANENSIDNIHNNLIEHYTQVENPNGITNFDEGFTVLSMNPNNYRKVLYPNFRNLASVNDVYLNADWYYIYDFDTRKFEVTDNQFDLSYGNAGLSREYSLDEIKDNIDSVIEELGEIPPPQSVERALLGFLTGTVISEPSQQINSPEAPSVQPETIPNRKELLLNLNFKNVITASIPENRMIDPITLEPIGIYFLRCEQDPRTAHYFDARTYSLSCEKGGPLPCTICPMDKFYRVSPQVYRVEENHPYRVRTLGEIDQDIDEKHLYIDGIVYQVLELKKTDQELTLSAMNTFTRKNVIIKIQGENRFEVDINGKTSYSMIYIL